MQRQRRSGPPVAGLLLILLGVLFLADQFSFLNFGRIVATWWPVVLILIGLSHLAQPGRPHGSGIVLVLLGGAFLLATLGITSWAWIGRLWPVALILVGISMVLATQSSRSRTVHEEALGTTATVPPAETDHVNAYFTSIERVVSSQSWAGIGVSIFCGSVLLDLRQARLAPTGATIRVSITFGSMTVRVPPGWKVESRSAPIIGSLMDKRRTGVAAPQTEPTLLIIGGVAFGGLEIWD
jgi:predicted membrane protein